MNPARHGRPYRPEPGDARDEARATRRGGEGGGGGGGTDSVSRSRPRHRDRHERWRRHSRSPSPRRSPYHYDRNHAIEGSLRITVGNDRYQTNVGTHRPVPVHARLGLPEQRTALGRERTSQRREEEPQTRGKATANRQQESFLLDCNERQLDSPRVWKDQQEQDLPQEERLPAWEVEASGVSRPRAVSPDSGYALHCPEEAPALPKKSILKRRVEPDTGTPQEWKDGATWHDGVRPLYEDRSWFKDDEVSWRDAAAAEREGTGERGPGDFHGASSLQAFWNAEDRETFLYGDDKHDEGDVRAPDLETTDPLQRPPEDYAKLANILKAIGLKKETDLADESGLAAKKQPPSSGVSRSHVEPSLDSSGPGSRRDVKRKRAEEAVEGAPHPHASQPIKTPEYGAYQRHGQQHGYYVAQQPAPYGQQSPVSAWPPYQLPAREFAARSLSPAAPATPTATTPPSPVFAGLPKSVARPNLLVIEMVDNKAEKSVAFCRTKAKPGPKGAHVSEASFSATPPSDPATGQQDNEDEVQMYLNNLQREWNKLQSQQVKLLRDCSRAKDNHDIQQQLELNQLQDVVAYKMKKLAAEMNTFPKKGVRLRGAAYRAQKPDVVLERQQKPAVERQRKTAVAGERQEMSAVAGERQRKTAVAGERQRKPAVAAERQRKPAVAAERQRKPAVEQQQKPAIAVEQQQKPAVERQEISAVAVEHQEKPAEVVEQQEKPAVAVEQQEKPAVEWQEMSALPCTLNTCYDAGEHWCENCSVTYSSLSQFLPHLHSRKHRQTLDPDHRPWVFQQQQLEWLQQREGASKLNSMPQQAKGSEFMMPILGYYCQLCAEFCVDQAFAQEHVISSKHNNNYQKMVQDNLLYEPRRMMGWKTSQAVMVETERRCRMEAVRRISEENKAKLMKMEEEEKSKLAELDENCVEGVERGPKAPIKISLRAENDRTTPRDKAEGVMPSGDDQIRAGRDRKEENGGAMAEPSHAKEAADSRPSGKTISIKLSGKTLLTPVAQWTPSLGPCVTPIQAKIRPNFSMALVSPRKAPVAPSLNKPASLDKFISIGSKGAGKPLPVIKEDGNKESTAPPICANQASEARPVAVAKSPVREHLKTVLEIVPASDQAGSPAARQQEDESAPGTQLELHTVLAIPVKPPPVIASGAYTDTHQPLSTKRPKGCLATANAKDLYSIFYSHLGGEAGRKLSASSSTEREGGGLGRDITGSPIPLVGARGPAAPEWPPSLTSTDGAGTITATPVL
ncbi:zinc finger protein 318 isoform X1 [Petromyzon marinus]|uniref:zinc finger protein 318 isoform X1 n=1 Tax=Petromyzon marinus TaxID=7757 RepID=UPI003F711FDC